MNDSITKLDLSQFYGSENLYFHHLFKAIKYTEGVKYLGANGASWLVTDILSFLKGLKKLQGQDFIHIVLKVADGKGTLTFDDGNDNVLFTNKYEYTDFPLSSVSFYYEYNTLMLVTER
jgi:hypothetical protein